MPVPYAIPGYAYVRANALLATLGTGATPSQIAGGGNYDATVFTSNASPIILTASFQSLANVAPTLVADRNLIITGTVACAWTGEGEPPTDQLLVNLSVQGEPVFTSSLVQDCTQGGATISFTYVVSASAGIVTIHLNALMDNGSTPFTVDVAGAQLTVQIVGT